MGDPTPTGAPPKPGAPPRREEVERVVIRPLPKAVVLYPTAVACVVFGLLGLFYEAGAMPHWVGLTFLAVFGSNLFIMAFEFTRGATLTMFVGAIALVFGALYLGKVLEVPVLSNIAGWFLGLNIQANAQLYLALAVLLGVIFIGVFFKSRFDYWEITSNELMHHHGLVGNVERFPAPNLRISKEIHDVLEWVLLRSGRLVLHPSGERRSIVLDLVFNVNRKEALIKELLSKLSVDIDDGHVHHAEH